MAAKTQPTRRVAEAEAGTGQYFLLGVAGLGPVAPATAGLTLTSSDGVWGSAGFLPAHSLTSWLGWSFLEAGLRGFQEGTEAFSFLLLWSLWHSWEGLGFPLA